ncbi:GIY-YIG nuclease family protein [Streptomyces sp. 8N616]|uniref:GIY-YIG nuclease family protein n=1 Tax=Streptomyces sp. 8N616 TaxID=3457414 RepID=UPI003FD1C2FE
MSGDAQFFLSSRRAPVIAYLFNPPPSWPQPPPGWVLPEGWRPDLAWPPPPGWQLWIEVPDGLDTASEPGRARRWAPQSPSAGDGRGTCRMQRRSRRRRECFVGCLGAFGERMFKIGMARRLEPLDRIRELGDASVPFRFDVHALIFSEDAVGLERCLHQEFEDRWVNRVNLRREFFYVTPAEVRMALERFAGEHLLEFHEETDAHEWRASGAV